MLLKKLKIWFVDKRFYTSFNKKLWFKWQFNPEITLNDKIFAPIDENEF